MDLERRLHDQLTDRLDELGLGILHGQKENEELLELIEYQNYPASRGEAMYQFLEVMIVAGPTWGGIRSVSVAIERRRRGRSSLSTRFASLAIERRPRGRSRFSEQGERADCKSPTGSLSVRM